MIQKAGRRVLDGMREWPAAAGDARLRIRDWGATAGRLSREMGERAAAALPARRPGGLAAARPRPGWAALAAAGAVLIAAGILLYLRKRRQVAAHYTMGEGESAGEPVTAGAFRDAEAVRS